MQDNNNLFLLIGGLFLCGLIVQVFARKLKIPRVTLLLAVGFLLGPSGFNQLSEPMTAQWFPIITKVALGMVGFLIGGTLTIKRMRSYGNKIIVIST